jgi:hypothetical protein
MQQTRATPPAERMAKHRAGVATQLREIKAAVEDLRSDLRAVLATRMVRKSIAAQEGALNAD